MTAAQQSARPSPPGDRRNLPPPRRVGIAGKSHHPQIRPTVEHLFHRFAACGIETVVEERTAPWEDLAMPRVADLLAAGVDLIADLFRPGGVDLLAPACDVRKYASALARRSPCQDEKSLAQATRLVNRLPKKAHLRRCAASFVTAAHAIVRLIPQDWRALHLDLFDQPVREKCFSAAVNE